MKILFICGSIKPGRDGVGDYVRSLACKLLESGHEAAFLALAEKSTDVEQFGTERYAQGTIETLSIPASFSNSRMIGLSRNFALVIQADIVSLQFVIFSYHKKGLPFGLGDHLYKIAPGTPWHIMFHEIWVGLNHKISVKMKLWAFLQRQIITSMCRELQPVVCHTHTRTYMHELLKITYPVLLLPLFSNIPPPSATFLLLKRGNKSDRKLNFLFFGTVHSGAPIDEFIAETLHFQQNSGREVVFNFIGRNGSHAKNWIIKLQAAGFEPVIMGEQPVEIISSMISATDFGVSTSAFHTIEKSGTVAAFLEYGIPVLCVTNRLDADSEEKRIEIPGIRLYETGNLGLLVEHPEPFLHPVNVGKIAEQFISDVSRVKRLAYLTSLEKAYKSH